MPGGLPSGTLPVPFQDFSGGLNTLNQPYLVTSNEARDLSNVQGTTAGAIVKRNGLVTFATPANVFTSLAPLESVNPVVLVGASTTHIYSIATNGTVSAIRGPLSSATPWAFVSAPVVAGDGPLYGMNGTDTPVQWSGTGSANSWVAVHGTVPNGTYMIYHQNQVFVAGVAANPSRLFWSGIADPTDWDPANLAGAGFEDFDPNDGQAITGIGVVGPYVIVFKPRKAWVLISPATGQSRQLSDNVGCVSHRSICTGAEGTYFLSEDRGVFVTNGSKLEPISDKIQPTLDAVAPALRSQAAATYFDGHYYLSVSLGGSTNDTTLDYDAKLSAATRQPSWWKHSFGSNQFAIWHPTTGNDQLYSAKATSAIVDQCFVPGITVDNGTPFTWTWRGAWQSPVFYRHKVYPATWFRKNLRQLRIQGAGTVDVSLAKNFAAAETLIEPNVFTSTTSSTFGGSTTFGGANQLFGGSGSILEARLFSLGVAEQFSVVFSATSTTQDLVVLYLMLVAYRKDQVVS